MTTPSAEVRISTKEARATWKKKTLIKEGEARIWDSNKGRGDGWHILVRVEGQRLMEGNGQTSFDVHSAECSYGIRRGAWSKGVGLKPGNLSSTNKSR